MNFIDQYIHEHLQQAIDETIRLCAQPSVSATGQGVRECAVLTADILRGHGLEVQSFETKGNPILVGRISGRSPRTLLFYNHYDVQPPEPLELWTSPPFEPTLREGALYARGVSDDKGELTARLFALDAVRAAHGGELPCGVTFVVEGEEEVSSPNIAGFVREHLELLACDAAIWEVGGVDLEGKPGTTLGARGILDVEMSVESMSSDAHSGNAHALPSAAWRLLRALACLKDENERILIPGWYDACLPPSERDLELLAAQPDHEAYIKQQFGIEQFLLGLTGMELKKAVFNPTCNIQGISSGYQGPGAKTIVPAQALAKLDFRLVPKQQPDEMYEKLCAYLVEKGFPDVKVRRIGSMEPYKSDADDPFFQLSARLACEVYGKELQMGPLGGGSSPIYAFAGPLGDIPVLWAGVGGPNGRAHSPDENIVIENFVNGSRYLARILEEFGGK
jgi:acetylornithine deacetylase/succinyl-diaminopimelate desuccinylase-like protein